MDKGKAFSAGFDLKSAAGLAPKEDTTPDLTTGISLEGDKYDGQGIKGGTGFGGVTEREGIKPVIAGECFGPAGRSSGAQRRRSIPLVYVLFDCMIPRMCAGNPTTSCQRDCSWRRL